MLATELKQEFDLLADTLDILGESQFRSRAYRRAALLMMEMTEHDLHSFSQKELEDMPGIGEGIAKKIIEYRETGHMKAAEKEEQKIPPGLFELLAIPNLGPKSIRKMWKGLGITDKADLEKAITEKTLEQLEGFGEKKVQKIADALDIQKKSIDRISYQKAIHIAEPLLQKIQSLPEVQKADIAGSIRRKEETIGDIDILAMSDAPEKVIEAFVDLPQVVEIIAQGTTKASVRIQDEGRQADIRVIPKESYGSALQYFTGSKAHNVELRKIAQKKGLKLSEYGLFDGEKRIAGETEEGVYKALGEKMPPPEERKKK